MLNLVVKVLDGVGGNWTTPKGEDKPQSYSERVTLARCAAEARADGHTGRRIMVTFGRPVTWVTMPEGDK